MNPELHELRSTTSTTAAVDEPTVDHAIPTTPVTRGRVRRFAVAIVASLAAVGVAPAVPAFAAVGGSADCVSNLGWGDAGSINVYPGRAAYGTIAVEYLVVLTSSGARYAGPTARAVTDGNGNWFTDRVGGTRLYDNRIQLGAPWSGYRYMMYEFLVNQSGAIIGQGYYYSYYIDPWTPRQGSCLL